MGLQHKAAAQGQGKRELELAHVNGLYGYIQKGDKDEHAYGDAGVAASENARKVRMGSEVTLSRSVIVLLVVGIVLISTVISIISGVVVYHKTNGNTNMARMNLEDLDRRLDTLEIQEIQNTPNMADIDQRMDTLDGMIQEVQNTPMYDINRRLDTLDGRMNAVQDTVEAVRAKQNTSGIVRDTVEAVQDERNTSAPKVAFTVHTPTGANIQHSPTFQHILLNEGGAYNTSTGQFTCPVQGLYLFTETLRGVYTRNIRVYCHIYLNNDRVTLAYSEGGPYDSASVTAFIHLTIGDVVELQCYRWQEIDHDMGTLFSGALIRAD